MWRHEAGIKQYLPAIVVPRALVLPANVASSSRILGRIAGQIGVEQPKMPWQMAVKKAEKGQWSSNMPKKRPLTACGHCGLIFGLCTVPNKNNTPITK